METLVRTWTEIRIYIHFQSWIRIHCEKLDLDPGPHTVNAAPQHCLDMYNRIKTRSHEDNLQLRGSNSALHSVHSVVVALHNYGPYKQTKMLIE
jgi:hypothetical protein